MCLTRRSPHAKGGDGFEAANEAAMAAEAAHACAHHRTTSFGALRGRAGGLIAPARVASRGGDGESSGNCGLKCVELACLGPVGPNMLHCKVSCIESIVRTAHGMRSDVRAEKPVFRMAAVGRGGFWREKFG